jgi:hypothetical protein
MALSMFEWLYPSRPASFAAPGGVEPAVQRLRVAVKRIALQTPFREALVGKVTSSRVVLARHQPWKRNSFSPTFVGRFVQRADGARLEGVFTLHPMVKWFMRLWFSFLFLFLIAVLGRIVTQPRMGEELLLVLIILAMIGFGAGMVRMGRGMGKDDVPFIESAVAEALGGPLPERQASGMRRSG